MDIPSRTTLTRATNLVARHPAFMFSHPWAPIILAVILVLAAAVPAHAQEEIEPMPSIMAPLAPVALTLDAATAGDKLVAVGERGHILVSDDGGATWKQSPSPTRAALTGVYFDDETTGWAVGHDGVILRTADAGSTWEIVNWAPEDEAPFFDVWFSDQNNGIAIGAYGSFYETTDGGTTWSSRWISEDDWHLHKIARGEGGKLFIAAEAGSIYRSDDGGANWITLESLYEGSYFGVLPLEGDSLLIFGLRGNLFRSDDAGENWAEIDTGTVAMLTDGIRLEDGTIIISGLGGTILVSSDGGLTFQLHPQANRRGISSIIDAGDGSLLMVGEFGVKTTTLADLMATTD